MVKMSDDSDSRSKDSAKKLKREHKDSSSSDNSDSGSDSSSKSNNSASTSSSSSSSSSDDAKPPSPKAAKRSQKDDDDEGEAAKEKQKKESKDKEESSDDDATDDESEGGEAKEEDEESGGDIGPMPKQKKKKVIPFEKIYLDNLPKSEAYERSFMHRDSIKFVLVAQKTHFIITASVDGHIKFWVKKAIGIEFVKHFRAHLGLIVDMSVNNPLGTLLATVADDQSLKIFDIVNFDMINMFKLGFKPGCVEWCYSTVSVAARHKDPFPVIAVSDAESNRIYTYEGTGSNMEPLRVLDRIHMAPVARMRFNPLFSTMVSVDEKGMLDYWGSHRSEYRFPSSEVVSFTSKLDTDLYELAKAKVRPHDIAFSPNGTHFAMICSDRKVRLFRFTTGKLIRVYDESLQQLTALQQATPQLPNMEFGRRMAAERDLEKVEHMFRSERILFDDSGYFLIYPTMLGIKIINWYSNKLVKMIGKGENFRPIALALHQTIPDLKTVKSTITPEMAASSNPSLEAAAQADPTLFTTGFRKNRFYLFSRREPDDSAIGESTADGSGILTGLERDVFNEKPSREDMVAATASDGHTSGASGSGVAKLAESACLHTTLGDIYLKLFAKECPRTVENFVTHCRNSYYNGHIFHRVIRQFMIQTGDPTGTGTGGQSIWGGEFEDEIVPELRHDRPFTLSMANAGPNTNGSQFFITVIPTPWLDNKHTVFGRVTKGMDVVQAISQVRTHPKTSKPYDDIKIINIQVK